MNILIKDIDIMIRLPGFSLFAYFLLLLVGLLFSKHWHEMLKWLKYSFLSFAVISLILGSGMFIYIYAYMSLAIQPFTITLPLPVETLTSYLKQVALNLPIYLTASALIFSALSLGLFYLPSLLPKGCMESAITEENIPGKNFTKYATYGLILLIILITLATKVNNISKDFEANNFYNVIQKLRNTNAVTHVIAAKDATIYALQINLLDKKTNKPVPNTHIKIRGNSKDKESFDEYITTDQKGVGKLDLAEGTFRLSFIPEFLPEEYQLPSPMFFDIKSPGTTVLTINLEQHQSDKWGIAEIEVLDTKNEPVDGLRLSIENQVDASGDPDSVVSITNSEGLAVFKLNNGDFSVIFLEEYFPEGYQRPSDFNINIVQDKVSRYTFRLVQKSKPYDAPK